MTNAKFLGMNQISGRAVSDLEHIRQSVADILITPVGSRPMRRAYGSLLSELIDQPQNPALRLQVMAASYSAILRWEPRVSLTGITFETTYDGKMVIDITGTRSDTAATFSLSVTVS
ncbi:GPW/gp25 family protein [Yersinia ruckeri]|uniref:GPW/gp25 family protein n=1 Tax=Yersinia ruckeri TaxID=29486 RepID=UPI0020C142F0|nr:GPW/gp25 family protein [Yersinia ruckeri]ELI6453659.1 GPW/gp25 family protein [Yersinia ruckeri]MCK8563480.1 GPW/gp25 family protein [Yersinia ruckeri]UZY17245.1 GPW/gp25 family protein [Yersinia ruckeri]